MFMGLGMPIPDLSNKPGPGRPGWGPIGSYDFQFEVAGSDPVTIKANAAGAGNFRISWPNGTTQVLSGDNASITAPDATEGIVSINNEELDTTYADEFAVISGQTAVTKVISWGQNAWSNMRNAFSGCTLLSDISTTSFTADSGCEMATMFNGCTSLLEADIKNWDLSAGVGWYGGSPFRNLANLRKLDMTGMNIKLTTRSDYAFASVGTAVTDGCEFLMSNIDWSTTTSAGIYTVYWFNSTIFKNTSNLSGWIFPSVGWNGTGTFLSSKIIGTNAIFNVSNWTTYSGSLFPRFTNFNSGLGNTGAKIDLTNFGMSNVNSMSTAFQATDVSEIVGLSTWGATAGSVNMQRAFWNSDHLSFLDNDNFSNTFIQSLTPTRVDQIFMNVGASSPNGVAPNISNIDLSNCTNFNQMLAYMQCNTVPAINTATFPSTAISLSSAFNRMRIQSNDETHLDFSNTTIKISNCNSMLDGAWIDKVTFGNNVDFSSLTIVNNMHRSMNLTNPNGTTTVLTYPTNADFSSLTNTSNWFASVSGPTTGPLTTCQVDNLIRRFRATAYGNALNVNFYQSQITEAPSVVRAQEAELVANGWTISENSTDATMPFVYTGSFLTGTDITPTINTSGGTFSSSDVTVNSATGTFNTSTAGNVTIRYTITATGCYNEQVLSVVPRFSPFKFRVTGPISIKAQPAVAGQNFTIDWGDGSTPVSTPGGTSIASPSYPAGTYDVQINAQSDATYCDEFAIVSGQTNVTQVLDWGENPWTNLSSAFLNCTNLTSISTTTLTTGVSSVLSSAFRSCTSLTEVNISSWDMTNAAIVDQMFDACTGLEVFQAENLNVNGGSRWLLRGTGTAVTDGCEYRLNGLNITSTSFGAGNMTQWFTNMKINPSSSFANISWPSIVHSGTSFQGSSITGVNSTLDCSGWTNYNSTIFPSFHTVTATEGGTSNMKINITNLNVSSVRSFNRSFMSTHASEIIGLGGLGATNGVTNMEYAFLSAAYMKFDNHNFSSDFINSFNLGSSNFVQVFKSCSSALALANAGPPPNLHSLDLSSVTSFQGAFDSAHFSTAPDFSNVTMSPTVAYNFNGCFQGMELNDNSNVNSLFSKTFKVSNFTSTFLTTTMPSIVIGNGVDFSSCTTMHRMFQNVNATDVQLPTNMDLGNITGVNGFQYTFLSGPTLSTCQVDNFIRRLHATALTNGLAIDFNNAAVTESPSIVRGLLDDLENPNGWSITVNSTDATIPFEYTGTLAPNTPITPTNNTGSAFTGTFTSSNSNIAVNATTGVINTPNVGNTTIRYTLDDGCFTEQAISLVSAEFSYSASAYCQDASDPTPTVTGTSGGTFTATLKVIPFQMQFDTSGGKTITIPGTVGSSFTVDWGDGNTTTETGGTISHTYASGIPTSTVSIGATGDSGPFTSLAFNNSGSKSDLIDIPQWGNIEFSSFSSMFNSCNNLDISATDTPDLSNCTSYYRAFYNCSSLTGTLSGVNWNWTFNGGSLSFRETFMRCELFNGDVSNWNISGATSLRSMFSCYSRPRGVFNRNLNSWDTSSVTDMSGVFYNQSFNGDIYNWDTSSATTMSAMFYDCIYFNQDINTKDTGTRLAWDVSSCSNFSNMFYNTSSFVTSINKWKIKTTGSAFSMSDMFRNANYNQTLNTSEVTVGQGVYQQTYLAWDVQKVNNFYRMFSSSSFNQSLSNWDTSSATNMNSMFSSSSFNQPITSQSVTVGSGSNQRTYNAWDVSLVSDTFRMFRSNTNFNQDLSSWDVSSLSNIGQMFSYSSVFNQNISDWNIINLSNGSLCFVSNNILTTENYTDSIVGWAVTVYNNSGSPSTVNFSGNGKTFDGTRTSDAASGQTYAAKYGSNWTATSWTDAQDAFDYLTTTLSWSIN